MLDVLPALAYRVQIMDELIKQMEVVLETLTLDAKEIEALRLECVQLRRNLDIALRKISALERTIDSVVMLERAKS